MRYLLLILFVIVLGSQDTYAQKLLLLQREGRVRNLKYFQGDIIIIDAYADTIRIKGRISGLTDSTILIDQKYEIPVDEITSILKKRTMLDFLSRGMGVFGLTYFTLNGFNRWINHEYPIYDKESLMIVTGSLAGYFALSKFKYRKFRIGNKWKIRILDLSFN